MSTENGVWESWSSLLPALLPPVSILPREFMLVTTHVVSQTSMLRKNSDLSLVLPSIAEVHDRIFRGRLLGLYQAVDIFLPIAVDVVALTTSYCIPLLQHSAFIFSPGFDSKQLKLPLF